MSRQPEVVQYRRHCDRRWDKPNKPSSLVPKICSLSLSERVSPILKGDLGVVRGCLETIAARQTPPIYDDEEEGKEDKRNEQVFNPYDYVSFPSEDQ